MYAYLICLTCFIKSAYFTDVTVSTPYCSLIRNFYFNTNEDICHLCNIKSNNFYFNRLSFFKCCPREISKIVSDQETKLKWMIEICLNMVSFCQPSLPVLTGSLNTNKGNKFSITFFSTVVSLINYNKR